MDVLTTHTHNSELQPLNKASAHLHALHITRAHANSSQSAFTSRFLVTDLNNADSSASVVTLLPAG
jgi:hypothetical protein